MIKKKKNLTVRIIGSIVVIVSVLIYVFSVEIHKINASDAGDLPPTYMIPADDSALIRKGGESLKAIVTFNHRGREPVSLISYNGVYRMVIYKINLTRDLDLKSLLDVRPESVSKTNLVVYSFAQVNDFFSFRYQADSVAPASKIIVTMAGDSIGSEMTDSVASFHLICKNFSVRYDEGGPIDIFLEGDEMALGRVKRIPLDIDFVKREKAVYMVLLTPENADNSIDPGMLDALIK